MRGRRLPGNIVHNTYYNAVQPTDLLTKLDPIFDASFTRNLKLSPPNSTCSPGTRLQAIRRIQKWAQNTDLHAVPHILWIFGYAGCGKSAIAQTIAEDFAQNGRLAACFFFFRGSGDRSGVSRFATTIASQMAAAIPSTKLLIEAAVTNYPSLLSHTTASISHQFEHLVYNPLKTVGHTLFGPVLIVLDGFDECGDREEAARFIEHMLIFFRRFPDAPFRVLIASRVEDHIHQLLHESTEVHLLNLVEHTSDKDIAAALEIEIEKNKKGSRVLACDKAWPSEQEKQDLVKHIGGSFIFMTTVIKFLFDSNLKDGLTPIQRLPLVLSMKPDFDNLYRSILEPCQHLPHFHGIVNTVALVFENLSISQIAELLELRTTDVVNVLVNLHAIMQVPGDDRSPVTLWHTTLRDFLTSEERSGPFLLRHCTTGDVNLRKKFPGLMVHLQNAVFKGGRTALEIACRSGNRKLVRELVNAKADVNVRFQGNGNNNIVTALHAACSRRKFDIIYFLLEKGANPNVSGPSTEYEAELRYGTPLIFASYTGDTRLVSRLLACGADPNLQGLTIHLYTQARALQAACFEGKLEVVKLLLKGGADPNLTGGAKGSALHACTWLGQIDCTRALLEHKADPNVRDQRGGTPLHDACINGRTRVAELLLDFGTNPLIRSIPRFHPSALLTLIETCIADVDVCIVYLAGFGDRERKKFHPMQVQSLVEMILNTSSDEGMIGTVWRRWESRGWKYCEGTTGVDEFASILAAQSGEVSGLASANTRGPYSGYADLEPLRFQCSNPVSASSSSNEVSWSLADDTGDVSPSLHNSTLKTPSETWAGMCGRDEAFDARSGREGCHMLLVCNGGGGAETQEHCRLVEASVEARSWHAGIAAYRYDYSGMRVRWLAGFSLEDDPTAIGLLHPETRR
ncbi:hypothetical protein NMY22_g14992 [Coprinellus aureogranulatus]|nr:hypothetical protein NMY22_g14992 [Coprinellus aureogranulatus]